MVSGGMNVGNNAYVKMYNASLENVQGDKNTDKVRSKDIQARGQWVASGQLLIDVMGSKPSMNILFYGRSSEYKGVLKGLNEFNKEFDKASGTPSGEVNVDKLKSKLQDVIRNADAYIKKHENNEDKSPRSEKMKIVKGQAERELAKLEQLGQAKLGDVPLKVAMTMIDLKLKGVEGLSTKYTDDKIVQKNDKFGSGAVNTVQLIEYRGDNNVTETRVLKPLEHRFGNPRLVGEEKTVGMKMDDLGIVQRNVASSHVAKMMGKEDMIPPTDIVLHGGQLFLGAPLAGGEGVSQNRIKPVGDLEGELMEDAFNRIGKGETSAEYDTNSFYDTYPGAVKIDGKWNKSSPVNLDVPLKDENKVLVGNICKQLLDLQVLDALAGQVDRNLSNVFIKIVGNDVQVVGIDNDSSFGLQDRCVKKDFRDLDARFQGAPPLMSQEMHDKIVEIHNSPVKKMEYRQGLVDSGLSEGQVTAAMGRLEDMYAHAKNLYASGCVVPDFSQFVYEDGKDNFKGPVEFLMDSKGQSIVQSIELLGGVKEPLNPDKHQ